MRGNQFTIDDNLSSMGGLVTEVESERVNPVNAGCISLKPGSIPACAGEPAVAAIGNYCRPVYPRVCGGICLVFNHEASHGNGLVYCHTAPDHRLEGPGPTAEVTGP